MAEEYWRDFGPFGGRTWLNCAHQGPLPKVAAEAAREAIGWKQAPFELTGERFSGVPARLRAALAELVNAPEREIVLGNSASYGIHLVANGIAWKEGDEVLVVAGDFPSDVLPWLGLEKRGVGVKRLATRNPLPEPDELAAAITPRTRLFCTTWVHSFSGYGADLEGLGTVCREHGVTFLVNASQALGARPLDVRSAPVDALVSAGFKWLCGPYGTGFCWLRRELLESLEVNQVYWLASMTAEDLGSPDLEIALPEGPATGRTYDIFGTANFFNFTAWTASLEYLLGKGLERIAAYDQGLVERLLSGLDQDRYEVVSPASGRARSTLVFVSHRDRERNEGLYQKLRENGVYVAFRRGLLRIAPHLYNTEDDIDQTLAVLNSA